MNTLAFDTCFGACSVAVTWATPEGPRGAFRFERLERGHAERLMPLIADAMSEAPFDFSALQRLVVTTGPGTFTGQRVGIAAARALSLATGAPVASLPSLAVMAHTAAHQLKGETAGKTLAAAVDARRGEIYVQFFSGPDLAALDEPLLTTPEDAARRLAGRDVVAVGSGSQLLADGARAKGLSISVRLATLEPDVRFVPEAAIPTDFGVPRPLYLRPPDAKPQDGASLARVS
ncbi:tRNA (adenosine(37)-N6)-threonylcarbamoyltransferase complex dimerization subunit type 1 TsaB [Hyphomicrobium sp.]|uniref:tRNA (adenosine(37)-N6)-threonylcarbamoyltransferase complex dimerization subunit type 1 TsaB n=1 Tax=Hyphomicrobium sp. TaxID=82 RepID=UPI002E3052BE|nr:tRNA (adenosine(37)-N6)-threonylcarbamoyltransferase complex dimerization subunit type 1 TsaB [Hyphomicrobium sp.]HEX2842208.1 tRNA (adenosine(37)-N6)-threonylcarbamoyltransferase complex dimerization subunit type 1 TsaB [Hyphomicrobium sp.]